MIRSRITQLLSPNPIFPSLSKTLPCCPPTSTLLSPWPQSIPGMQGTQLSVMWRKVYLAPCVRAASVGMGTPSAGCWEALGRSKVKVCFLARSPAWDWDSGDTWGCRRTAGCRQHWSLFPSFDAGEGGSADPAGKMCQQDGRGGCGVRWQGQISPCGFPGVLV